MRYFHLDAAQQKAIVVEVLTTAFTNRDFRALERYFSPDYIQHNPFIPPRREGLRDFIAALPAGRKYEMGIAFADGDFVIVHGRYSGGGTKTLVAADFFRFQDGLVVEHWDVLQNEVPSNETVAGNAMFTPAEAPSPGSAP